MVVADLHRILGAPALRGDLAGLVPGRAGGALLVRGPAPQRPCGSAPDGAGLGRCVLRGRVYRGPALVRPSSPLVGDTAARGPLPALLRVGLGRAPDLRRRSPARHVRSLAAVARADGAEHGRARAARAGGAPRVARPCGADLVEP